MRDDIKNFPRPVEESTILGHDGSLTAEEVAHLESLGYVVAPYRAFTGQKLMQAYFEGLAKGLIEMDPKTFKSMESIRKQLMKLAPEEGDLKDTGKVAKVDVVTLLKNKGSVDVGVEPTRRRGRPPGR